LKVLNSVPISRDELNWLKMRVSGWALAMPCDRQIFEIGYQHHLFVTAKMTPKSLSWRIGEPPHLHPLAHELSPTVSGASPKATPASTMNELTPDGSPGLLRSTSANITQHKLLLTLVWLSQCLIKSIGS
jgi:hypothetical protein